MCVKRYFNLVITLVFTIIWVGGVTRLTGSGLSITEWQLFTGILPPLSDSAWELAFQKYQTIPQYTLINEGMELSNFKIIYFWEWFHRLVGRSIGLVAFIGFALLSFRGLWPSKRIRHKTLIGALMIAAQGAIGWYMVKSGLNQGTSVSPYRLSIHLSTAFVILYYWTRLSLDLRPASTFSPLQASSRDLYKLRVLFYTSLSVFALQVIYGAWVAGMKAGYAFPTYPLMGGEWFPWSSVMEGKGLLNLSINPIVIQWVHRWLGVAVLLVCGYFFKKLYNFDHKEVRRIILLLTCSLVAQFALGIATLVYGVPVLLGSLHQLNAGILVFLFARLSFFLKTGNP